MKKMAALLLALTLTLGGFTAAAQAEQSAAGYTGKVAFRETMTLTAPFGGVVQDFALRAGDAVAAGETLFTLSTTKVYAALDGTVRGLMAQPGDEAQAVADRYGALLYLEPKERFTVAANTNNAYKSDTNDNLNRYLNQGDVVYLRSSSDNDRTGVGVITAVDGRSFDVEVQSGNLIVEDTVSIYRDVEYSSSQRIASYAKVQHAAATPVTAEGSILRVLVTQGQTVRRGDLLLETVQGTLEGLTPVGDQVTSPVDGVLVSVSAKAGESVAQDGVLATLAAVDALWVEFNLDESDLDTVHAGDRVQVIQDALPDRAALEGTVLSVSSVNEAESGDAKYTAYVELDSVQGLRQGMNVSVYLR
ncbi:MAG: HlyD family efflux transporter periplasmic adaptor subunit [Clostridiales bacterium]|nr:HlyD family efflux transporter periplasmic adaptor subunit [Clostridiales bacterium]